MKKIILSLLIVGALILYTISQRNNTPKDINTSSQSSDSNSKKNSNVTLGASYKDGIYTGDVADAYFGLYQVQAVINNGKIEDIKFLQYPSDRRTSVEINTRAMQYLKQEAIQSQNSKVDIVSGATQSSIAFRHSLQSALDKAL